MRAAARASISTTYPRTAPRRRVSSTSGSATGGRSSSASRPAVRRFTSPRPGRPAWGFAADRAPIPFRPRGETGVALRRLRDGGSRIGAFTDAPRELAELALAHVGATRRVDVVGTRNEVLADLGAGARVVNTRAELLSLD